MSYNVQYEFPYYFKRFGYYTHTFTIGRQKASTNIYSMPKRVLFLHHEVIFKDLVLGLNSVVWSDKYAFISS